MAYCHGTFNVYFIGRTYFMMIKVKKKHSERLSILFSFCFIVLITLVIALVSRQGIIVFVCLPLIAFFLLWFLYLQKWEIVFEKNCFYIKKLRRRRYTYNQIKHIYKSYSFTQHAYVSISLTDGKNVYFRLEDENAQVAIKELRRHHSIKES